MHNRFMAMLLAAVMLCLPVRPLRTAAETVSDAAPVVTADSSEPASAVTAEPYHDYYERYADAPRPDVSVLVPGKAYLTAEADTPEEIRIGSCGSEYGTEDRDDVLCFLAMDGVLTYQVDVPETGMYCLEMCYLPIPSELDQIEFSLAIDGEIPYATASRAVLTKVFVDDGAFSLDAHGNQIRPAQKQIGMWKQEFLRDPDGLYNDPLCFYFEAGTHTLTFDISKGCFALESFCLRTPEALPGYADYRSGIACDPASTPSTLLRLEGEQATYKSSASLCATADRASYLASPADPAKTVYNTIGAGTWDQALETITWSIPADALPADGMYRLGIKARQNVMRGMYANRRIYVDGKVPFAEYDQVRFYYDNDWQLTEPETAEGEPLYLYLTGGEPHTITMEVIPGEIGDYMCRLDAVVRDINTCYRKILMITGPTPDKYTDYYVHERIPELLSELERLSAELKSIRQEMETLADSQGSEAAAMERMYIILDSCLERPLRIPDYLTQIKDNITALSAWMHDYRQQPLEVDYLELASADREFSPVKEKLLPSLSFGWQRFVSSFFEDYTTLSDTDGENTINVWVSQGRDQALVIKTLTDSEFAAQSDADISINLVVGGVVEASLAGKGPDVALYLGGEFPVNLAARGLLTDLSQFPDYEEVMTRFQEHAGVPYQYGDGAYGLPLSQSWAMLFYRKDILAELGYDHPPETWDELTDMLPALQRNYMYAGLVLPTVTNSGTGTATAVSAATESGHTFAAMMLQSGMNYYDPGQTKTNFDSITAVQAFERWTDFYRKYGFEQIYDAFSRFRTGEYPLVIADYSFYNQLTTASPELDGLWDFTLIPGTVQPDGSISHAVNSNCSGAVIFDKCKDKEGAWEFLKWFTQADVQAEYGRQLEGLLGQLGRYTTANTEALTRLGWSRQEQETLLRAQSELEEIPIIPASYAVTRNLMNAFRETVNNYENPRDTLLWYNRDINAEITRKRKNLGLTG